MDAGGRPSGRTGGVGGGGTGAVGADAAVGAAAFGMAVFGTAAFSAGVSTCSERDVAEVVRSGADRSEEESFL